MTTAGIRGGLGNQRQFRFGVCSDVQYADIPDGASFKGVPRFYRAALTSVRRAVEGWRNNGCAFGVNFGDTVDGYAKDNAGEALERVLREFTAFGAPVYHLLGNHDFYNLSREHLITRLGIPSNHAPGSSYYSVTPHPGWKIVMLDAYDVSALGREASHPHSQMAAALLAERNPNHEKNSPVGLEGTERRFVKYNGGVGAAQLQWLHAECQAAVDAGQRVILGSHVPIHPSSCHNSTLIWNYSDILAIVEACPNVVATISGHTHNDGYHCDEQGVHHRVLKGIIETAPGVDCYGLVDVYDDRIELAGCGILSQVLRLRENGQGRVVEGSSKPQASFGEMALEVMELFPSMQVTQQAGN